MVRAEDSLMDVSDVAITYPMKRKRIKKAKRGTPKMFFLKPTVGALNGITHNGINLLMGSNLS